MKVLFKDVQWDTDGETLESCGLESTFVADVDIEADETDEEIEDILSDFLSDEYGFCHEGFEFEIIGE